MSDNKICLACGKSYEFCNTCYSGHNTPVWKNLFHDEKCKNVFETVSDFAQGAISKDVARVKLSKCGLSQSDKFTVKIEKYLSEINAKDVVEKTTKKPSTEVKNK